MSTTANARTIPFPDPNANANTTTTTDTVTESATQAAEQVAADVVSDAEAAKAAAGTPQGQAVKVDAEQLYAAVRAEYESLSPGLQGRIHQLLNDLEVAGSTALPAIHSIFGAKK